MEIGKTSLFVTIGRENVLGMMGNDDIIYGPCKIRAKLTNLLLS